MKSMRLWLFLLLIALLVVQPVMAKDINGAFIVDTGHSFKIYSYNIFIVEIDYFIDGMIISMIPSMGYRASYYNYSMYECDPFGGCGQTKHSGWVLYFPMEKYT